MTKQECLAYLQVFLVIGVFTLGLPALVFQTFFTADLRDVARRRMRKIFLRLAIVLWFFSVVLLVVLLNPGVGLRQFGQGFERWCVIAIDCSILLILLFTILWWRSGLSLDVKSALLSDLGRRINKSVCKQRPMQSDQLSDIRTLGSFMRPGKEKSAALSVLNEIIDSSISHTFDGRSLVEVINVGVEILTPTIGFEGNDENLLEFGSTLERLWGELTTRNLQGREDGGAVIIAFAKLSAWSAEKFSTSISLRALQLSPPAPLIAFETGRTSLAREDYRLAGACIGRLERLSESKHSADPDLYTIGLASLLYKKGHGYRRRALMTLSFLGKRFDGRLLLDADQFHYLIGNFDVVDSLEYIAGDFRKFRIESTGTNSE